MQRRKPVRTDITHTVNVVQKERGYFSGSEHTAVVTKYVIKVSVGAGRYDGSNLPMEWQVARRYSHFRSNHAALSSMFAALPKLPPKKLSMGNQPLPDPELVADRMVLLDTYLKQLLALPAVCSCTQMRTFLGAYQGMQPSWFEEVSMQRLTPLDADFLSVGDESVGMSPDHRQNSRDSDHLDERRLSASDVAPDSWSPPRSRSSSKRLEPGVSHPELGTSQLESSGREPSPASSDFDSTPASSFAASAAASASAATISSGCASTSSASASNLASRCSEATSPSSIPFQSSPVPSSPVQSRPVPSSQSSNTLDPPPLHAFTPGGASDGHAANAIIRDMGLMVSVDAFAAQFHKLRYSTRPNYAAGMAQRFLNGMEAAVAISHPEGAEHCTDGMLRWARDSLEDRLLHRIHNHVFGALSDEATHDKLLASRLRALAALLTPAQLDVPPAFCDTRFNRWTAAAAELGLMCERRTARGKMDCVLQCVLQLKQGFLFYQFHLSRTIYHPSPITHHL